MGRSAEYPSPLVAYALHDDDADADADVVDGDLAEAIHNGLPVWLS